MKKYKALLRRTEKQNKDSFWLVRQDIILLVQAIEQNDSRLILSLISTILDLIDNIQELESMIYLNFPETKKEILKNLKSRGKIK